MPFLSVIEINSSNRGTATIGGKAWPIQISCVNNTLSGKLILFQFSDFQGVDYSTFQNGTDFCLCISGYFADLDSFNSARQKVFQNSLNATQIAFCVINLDTQNPQVRISEELFPITIWEKGDDGNTLWFELRGELYRYNSCQSSTGVQVGARKLTDSSMFK